MTGCRGISCYFNLWRICWELIELLWIPPKRTFILYGRNVVFEEVSTFLLALRPPVQWRLTVVIGEWFPCNFTPVSRRLAAEFRSWDPERLRIWRRGAVHRLISTVWGPSALYACKLRVSLQNSRLFLITNHFSIHFSILTRTLASLQIMWGHFSFESLYPLPHSSY